MKLDAVELVAVRVEVPVVVLGWTAVAVVVVEAAVGVV